MPQSLAEQFVSSLVSSAGVHSQEGGDLRDETRQNVAVPRQPQPPETEKKSSGELALCPSTTTGRHHQGWERSIDEAPTRESASHDFTEIEEEGRGAAVLVEDMIGRRDAGTCGDDGRDSLTSCQTCGACDGTNDDGYCSTRGSLKHAPPEHQRRQRQSDEHRSVVADCEANGASALDSHHNGAREGCAGEGDATWPQLSQTEGIRGARSTYFGTLIDGSEGVNFDCSTQSRGRNKDRSAAILTPQPPGGLAERCSSVQNTRPETEDGANNKHTPFLYSRRRCRSQGNTPRRSSDSRSATPTLSVLSLPSNTVSARGKSSNAVGRLRSTERVETCVEDTGSAYCIDAGAGRLGGFSRKQPATVRRLKITLDEMNNLNIF